MMDKKSASRAAHKKTRQALPEERQRILMCPPDYFGISYVINPWMEANREYLRPDEATRQWNAFKDRLAAEADVEMLPPMPNLPDLAFISNAGLVLGDTVILSQFRYLERQREEEHCQAFFKKLRYEIIRMPEGVFFEGAGDALFDRGAARIWLGHGFRTALDAAGFLSDRLQIDVLPLRLVDERFYHLDTCFAPLAGGYLIYYPKAFDAHSRHLIEETIPAEKRYAVDEPDATRFACNALDIGTKVFLNDCSEEMEKQLAEWGFEVNRVPLGEFVLVGAGARCLCLRLSETLPKSSGPHGSPLACRSVTLEGQLIDSQILADVLDRITTNNGNFVIDEFRPGPRRQDNSFARITVTAPSAPTLQKIVAELLEQGARLEDADGTPARLETVRRDGVAPEDFYATTIYPTDILIGGRWMRVTGQRMDGVIVVGKSAGGVSASVSLIRDLRKGHQIVTGEKGLRIHTGSQMDGEKESFSFMSSSASSERRVETAVDQTAQEMVEIRQRGGRIVWVCGPVVVHTGGIPYLCEMVRMGFMQALLGGNAIAVHDIERAMFGTSLGIDLSTGKGVVGGHRHHLSAINRIRECGGIAEGVRRGVLTSGLMYELVRHDIPFCLAGSIRDDGPLPETRMDLIQAQTEYAQLLQGSKMILMLSTMLHSIGVGNMTPAGVKMVSVDINSAVATKLADRGSMECRPVITDVGLFLNLLARRLKSLET